MFLTAYPVVTIIPRVVPGLRWEDDGNTKGIKFDCMFSMTAVLQQYVYNVIWYINDNIVKTYIEVDSQQLPFTTLNEAHWIDNFTLSFKVRIPVM